MSPCHLGHAASGTPNVLDVISDGFLFRETRQRIGKLVDIREEGHGVSVIQVHVFFSKFSASTAQYLVKLLQSPVLS
jgi:hypothetical protein